MVLRQVHDASTYSGTATTSDTFQSAQLQRLARTFAIETLTKLGMCFPESE